MCFLNLFCSKESDRSLFQSAAQEPLYNVTSSSNWLIPEAFKDTYPHTSKPPLCSTRGYLVPAWLILCCHANHFFPLFLMSHKARIGKCVPKKISEIPLICNWPHVSRKAGMATGHSTRKGVTQAAYSRAVLLEYQQEFKGANNDGRWTG